MTGPSASRKHFAKQEDAIRYSLLDEDYLVFAWELGRGGERKFLVCTKEVLWHFYKHLDQKHFYEVIPEHKPCKLYFDLEFLTKSNPDKNGYEMTEALIVLINKELVDKFNCLSHTEDVIILDSSHEKKFSVHLIFCKAVFHSNEHCGYFVRKFLSSISSSERKCFEVQKDDETSTSFIDCSVYSRNRNFRLFLSRKFGKTTSLTVSPIDLFSLSALENNCQDLDQYIFMNSLITNIDQDAAIIEMETCCFDKPKMNNKNQRVTKNLSNFSTGKSSPYSEIDEFVTHLVQPGRIRQWKYCSESETIVYDIAESRWCGRIQREHRSNHVYYTCNLARGIVYQECHDDDCRGWRGEDIPLPSGTFTWINDLKDWSQDEEDECLFDDTDNEYLLEASFGY